MATSGGERLLSSVGRAGRSGSLGRPPAWERGVWRRRWLGGAASATAAGVALGTALLAPPSAWAFPAAAGEPDDERNSTVDPRPIPGGSGTTHHFLPGRGHEITTVTDFDGVVGIAQLTGTGHGTGFSAPLNFSVDNRFLVGAFVGVDGKRHRGAFGVF
jgi:hypothetical protein